MTAILSEVRRAAYRSPAATVDELAAPDRSPIGALDERACAAGFAALLTAYRSSGGTAREDVLAPLLRDHRPGDTTSLTWLIGGGSMFGFKWRRTLWVPMFQFDADDLSLAQGLREVLSELVGVFDGWQLARWFAEPSAWLEGRRPAESLAHDWHSVLHAAHASRMLFKR